MSRLLSANASFEGEACCRGRLHLIRHYPRLVLSEDAADVVHGELYRLREPDALLREFDMYEACGESFKAPTEYVRQVCPLTRADGGSAEAWTYIYNWQVTNLPRIESGRFTAQ
jgi:gamma-glutamylcyclotransferase (GGCT)/AIG2-like uncharacterized protein YtfP